MIGKANIDPKGNDLTRSLTVHVRKAYVLESSTYPSRSRGGKTAEDSRPNRK